MALSGVHISCGYSGPNGGAHGQVSLLGRAMWSQTMASAGTTTRVAPDISDSERESIFSLYASADIYYALGVTPDAATGTRRFLPAATAVDVFAQPGDKVAWILA
jgi:hypothetical protein